MSHSLTASLGCPPILFLSLDCCGVSSNSYLALLLRVLSSNVHRCQNPGFFFCENTHCSFIFSIDTESNLVDFVNLISNLYIWWKDFWSSSLVTTPRAQLWFCSHLCLCVIHKILFPRLSWSTWVCPVKSECGGDVAAWIACSLEVPGMHGNQWPQVQKMHLSFSRFWAALSQWGLSLEVMQLLRSLGNWLFQVHSEASGHRCRRYGAI